MFSMKKSRLTAIAGLVAASALVLSACGGTSGANDAGGDTEKVIRATTSYASADYHPSRTSSGFTVLANWHVVEALYNLDYSDYSVVRGLAAGAEPTKITDTEYEVKIRESAKFSDGTLVTAADVVASYNRMIEGEEFKDATTGETKKSPSMYAAFLTLIKSMEAKDESTVSIFLNYPSDVLKERLVNIKVVPASSTFDQNTKMPIGSGPYKYSKIDGEKFAEAVPNEYYNGDTPATVDKIVWTEEVVDATRVTAALGGTVDIVENVDPQGARKLEAKGWKVEENTQYGIAMAMFNTAKAPFDKAVARQAALTAIDINTIIETALGGAAVPAKAFLPETNSNFKPAATQFTFDLDAAKAKLSEAGVAPRTKITVLSTDHSWIEKTATQVVENLKALGFDVSYQKSDSGNLWNNIVANGDFNLVVAPGDPGIFGSDPGIYLRGWFLADLFLNDRTRLSQSDPTGADELRKLMKTADEATGEEAKAAWGSVLDKAAELVPIYPILYHTIKTAYNPEKLENVETNGTTGLQLLGVTVR